MSACRASEIRCIELRGAQAEREINTACLGMGCDEGDVSLDQDA